MRGTWQTTDSSGGLGLVVGLAVAGAVGYAVYRIVELIAEKIVALEVGVGVVAVAAVTGVVLVLRHQRGRTHLDAPEWVTQRLGAPPIRSSAAIADRPAAAIPARPPRQIAAPAAVHYHLHLHAPALPEHQQEQHGRGGVKTR